MQTASQIEMPIKIVLQQKKDRLMEIFYRAMKGEHLSVKQLAQEYGVSLMFSDYYFYLIAYSCEKENEI